MILMFLWWCCTLCSCATIKSNGQRPNGLLGWWIAERVCLCGVGGVNLTAGEPERAPGRLHPTGTLQGETVLAVPDSPYPYCEQNSSSTFSHTRAVTSILAVCWRKGRIPPPQGEKRGARDTVSLLPSACVSTLARGDGVRLFGQGNTEI